MIAWGAEGTSSPSKVSWWGERVQIIIVGTRAATHYVPCQIMMPEVEKSVALESPKPLIATSFAEYDGPVWLWPVPAW